MRRDRRIPCAPAAEHERDRVAHERDGRASDSARSVEIDRDRAPRRRDDIAAPAVGERAQPGDILGIASAGETTSLGDTASDEDKRRERAEKDMRGREDRAGRQALA